MSSTQQRMDPWHDQEPTATQKALVKDALVNYIVDKELRDKWPKPSNQLCKSMLPWLQPLNRKWEKVTQNNFDPGQHVAHRRLYDIVRHLLNSGGELKKMIQAYDEENDAQTDMEINRMTTPGNDDDVSGHFRRPDELEQITIEGTRNLDLPESVEDVASKSEPPK